MHVYIQFRVLKPFFNVQKPDSVVWYCSNSRYYQWRRTLIKTFDKVELKHKLKLE